MKIGILELMSAGATGNWSHAAYNSIVTRQYASIMPQVISVWCRNLGHTVFYATYFGNQDPKKLLPADLDIVFISTYTQASALAYALAKLFRKEKTLTIIGGPHAKQFPDDCARFFDVVIGDCDQTLIQEVLRDRPRKAILNSGRILKNIPGIEERMPEIRAATLFKGRPLPFTSVPLITSLGCPNACDFCIDWNNPYVLLPLEQLEADIRYIFNHLPNVLIGIHDPNFAIKFEPVFDVMEKIPKRHRYSYIMETSLNTLHGDRLARLKAMGKFYIIPGIESWTAYSNKVGAGTTATPLEKLNKVIDQCENIRPNIMGMQANFMFGLDTDSGDEFLELTREFASRVPYVMPNFNIPVPFGNTPLYVKQLSEDRLLKAMPFTFYYMPYLVFKLKNYTAAAFYARLIGIISYISSPGMRFARFKSAGSAFPAGYHLIKAFGNQKMISRLKEILDMLETDGQFRAFHDHETDVLPEFYHREYEKTLGPYAGLMPREERQPIFNKQKVGKLDERKRQPVPG